MLIHFSYDLNTTYIYDVYAEIVIKGKGYLDVCLDDLLYSDVYYNIYYKDGIVGLSRYIFDTYLDENNLNEDNIMLDESDLNCLLDAYNKEKNKYSKGI